MISQVLATLCLWSVGGAAAVLRQNEAGELKRNHQVRIVRRWEWANKLVSGLLGYAGD